MQKIMKPFSMVLREIWRAPRFRALPDDDARFLELYLRICSHQTRSGCLAPPDAYVVDDLSMTGSKWTIELYHAKREALVEGGSILHDAATNEILIVDWWEHQQPSNDDWFKGAFRHCETIRSDRLRTAAIKELNRWYDAFKTLKLTDKAPSQTGVVTDLRAALANNRLSGARTPSPHPVPSLHTYGNGNGYADENRK